MKALIAALAVFFAMPSVAQTTCKQRELVYLDLVERHGESRLQAAVSAGGEFIFEFWGNPETGTWTILRSDALSACLLVSGQSFESFEANIAPTGMPT